MELRIENRNLQNTIDLLFDLPLRGKQSRHRSKLIKLLQKSLQDVAEQEQEMLVEHCHLDEEGNPKMIEGGTRWDVKDLDAFAKDKNEFLAEEVVIDGAANEEVLKTVRRILEECDKEFVGHEAQIYDELYDQLEEQEAEVAAEETPVS